jgi:hypothetical protein
LIPDNFEIWNLFQMMIPGLVTQGGYDYNAIQVILDSHSIGQAERPQMLAQVIKLIDVIETERRERAKK